MKVLTVDSFHRDFSLEAMELSASEPSIYDKLSETIDLVRQTGYQCGMSEKAIEKFVKQLLEKNEPQRGPPRYPHLMGLCKVKCLSHMQGWMTRVFFALRTFGGLEVLPLPDGVFIHDFLDASV